jgi:hypothetical protein
MTDSSAPSAVGIDWDAPRYSAVEACMAIHCNTQWLTNLISGATVVYGLGEDEMVERVKRRKFVFKFRTVFHLAIMREISSRGSVLPLAAARDLSRICASSDFLFSAAGSPGGAARYLVIAPASGVSKMLVRSVGGTPLTLEDLASVGHDPSESRIVLNATAVFDQVVEALDLLEVAGELMD